jgi:CheY-like chemotaxis protein
MRYDRPATTIAILGANTLLERVLAQLLEGFGYSVSLLKSSPKEVVDEQQPGGVDLVVLSPNLTSGACDAILGALRSTSHRRRTTQTSSPIPVIVLCTTAKEAPLVEEAVRIVPWPVPLEHLAGEIEAFLARRLPSGYWLDRSDPDVSILLSPSGSVISRFSGRGAQQQSIEREAWEDYRERSRPA